MDERVLQLADLLSRARTVAAGLGVSISATLHTDGPLPEIFAGAKPLHSCTCVQDDPKSTSVISSYEVTPDLRVIACVRKASLAEIAERLRIDRERLDRIASRHLTAEPEIKFEEPVTAEFGL